MLQTRKFISFFTLLAGILSAQKPWFEGNLKGLHRYHVKVKAVGIEHLYSEPELKTFVESKPALKFEILEGTSSQACIKVNVQVIIEALEQENILCQLVWKTIIINRSE